MHFWIEVLGLDRSIAVDRLQRRIELLGQIRGSDCEEGLKTRCIVRLLVGEPHSKQILALNGRMGASEAVLRERHPAVDEVSSTLLAARSSGALTECQGWFTRRYSGASKNFRASECLATAAATWWFEMPTWTAVPSSSAPEIGVTKGCICRHMRLLAVERRFPRVGCCIKSPRAWGIGPAAITEPWVAAGARSPGRRMRGSAGAGYVPGPVRGSRESPEFHPVARADSTDGFEGADLICWWHTKLERYVDRIHLCPDLVASGGPIVVGIFCQHLTV